MGRYLDALKNNLKHAGGVPKKPKELPKSNSLGFLGSSPPCFENTRGNSLGFLGTPQPLFEKSSEQDLSGGNPIILLEERPQDLPEPDNDPAANIRHFRWLVHYPDRDPEINTFTPELTHGEVLAWKTDAIAAEPMPDTRYPVTDCIRPLTPTEKKTILAYLIHIGSDDEEQAEILANCQASGEARDYFLREAVAIPSPKAAR